MSIFNYTRKLANTVLSPIGIAVERTNKSPWNWFKPVIKTSIGKYAIAVPAKNPVTSQYRQLPHLVSQLGRLVSLLKTKYENFAAIDVGANVGDTACIIKSAADIPLICIEGDEFTFDFLQKNISQFQNTTAHKLFLGERTSTISVDIEKAGWNLTLKPSTGSSAKNVKLTSLDDFMAAQSDVTRFKLLKIDTEGFDCSIIRGALTYIRSASPVITLEYNRGNMDAIGEPGLPTLFKLQEHGYSHIVFHDQDGRFLLSTTLANHVLVNDLHDYADCVRGRIGYLDITAFHESDTDIADVFVEMERSFRSPQGAS